MSIGPVTRRKTSLNTLWARWYDAAGTVPAEPARPKPAITKAMATPLGLASRQRRPAGATSLSQMSPRSPAPKSAAFNGTEAMTKALNARRRT